jgi:hypothetical protein
MAVTNTFVRLTQRTASAGGGQIRLLSPGTLATDFNGTLTFGAATLNIGDTIRIFAWGKTKNSSGSPGNARLRLYFNSGSPANLSGEIADSGTGAQINVIAGQTNEYVFMAQILITATGDIDEGEAWCDSYVLNVENPTNLNKMMGKAGSFAIDTSVANQLELTVTVTTQGGFDLDQCTVEYLPTP